MNTHARRTWSLALGLAAAVTTIAVPAASAGTTSAGGLKYVTDKSLIPPGDYAGETAECPEGTAALGGGVEATGELGDVRLHGGGPVDRSDADQDPDDGWASGADNVATTQRTLKAWAVCTRRAPRYTASSFLPVPAGGTYSAGLTGCFPDTTVVAGGPDYNSNGFGRMHVRQSAPVDSGDPGIKPEGWLVDIANKNVDPGYFRIAMICAKGKYKYLTRAFNVTPQTQKVVELKCPAGTHAVSGGVRFAEPPVGALLTGSRPIDRKDGDRAPDDGWRVRVDNLHVTNSYMGGIHAVCKA